MTFSMHYLSVLVLASSAVAQRIPAIHYITPDQIKDIGEVVELECCVHYADGYPIAWSKVDSEGETIPISSSIALILRDNRFAIRYDRALSTYILQIKDIQETDAGRYQCQIVTADKDKITADEVELFVRRPPVFSDNSTRSRIVREGEEVILECYATGYPNPRISWRRQDNAPLPTGGSLYRGNVLKINSVRKEDRGTYYCVAENGVGRGTHRSVLLQVEFPPVISVARDSIAQKEGYDMDLQCHVEAFPPPAISWSKDGIRLSNNQHFSISNFGTEEDVTDSILRVITIERSQYGNYTCEASNKLGTSLAHLQLHESVTPVCPPACDGNPASTTLKQEHQMPNMNYP